MASSVWLALLLACGCGGGEPEPNPEEAGQQDFTTDELSEEQVQQERNLGKPPPE